MNITIERYEQIEQERQQTFSDPNFQKWVQELNVSRMDVSKEGKLRSRDIMSTYDFSKHKINFKTI